MNNNKFIKSLLAASLLVSGFSNAAVIITQQSPIAGIVQQQQQQNQQDQQQNTQQQSNTQQQQQQQASTSTVDAGNAYAQGYGQQNDAEAMKQALLDYQQDHSPRQLGEQVQVPGPIDVVANDKSSYVWLMNWKGLLVDKAGVSAKKVDFESRRLNKEDFAKWASRQYRFVHPNDTYVSP